MCRTPSPWIASPHATGLDRNKIGTPLVAAGLASARKHRTLTALRKGGKVVTIPLAPRTARAIDLAIGERVEGRDNNLSKPN